MKIIELALHSVNARQGGITQKMTVHAYEVLPLRGAVNEACGAFLETVQKALLNSILECGIREPLKCAIPPLSDQRGSYKVSPS